MEDAIDGVRYYECEKSDQRCYGFTVKDNRVDCTDYKEFFDRVEKLNIKVVSKYAEKDKKGKLHYHGIMIIPKGFYRKRLVMEGLHLKLVEIYDIDGWNEYIQKDQEEDLPTKDEIKLMSTLKKKLF